MRTRQWWCELDNDVWGQDNDECGLGNEECGQSNDGCRLGIDESEQDKEMW